MLEYHGCLKSEIEEDMYHKKVKFLDVVLATIAKVYEQHTVIFYQHFVWVSKPVTSFQELRDFGLFFAVCSGKLYNMCKYENMASRNLHFINNDNVKDNDVDGDDDNKYFIAKDDVKDIDDDANVGNKHFIAKDDVKDNDDDADDDSQHIIDNYDIKDNDDDADNDSQEHVYSDDEINSWKDWMNHPTTGKCE